MERFLITLFNTQDALLGYNLTAGGEGLVNPTEEVRRKISIAGMGRTPSLETRRKISEYHKGNKYWLGRSHSDRTRLKQSLSAMGNQYSRGYKASVELREMRRQRMLGNSLSRGIAMSKDSKYKKSLALTAYWQCVRSGEATRCI